MDIRSLIAEAKDLMTGDTGPSESLDVLTEIEDSPAEPERTAEANEANDASADDLVMEQSESDEPDLPPDGADEPEPDLPPDEPDEPEPNSPLDQPEDVPSEATDAATVETAPEPSEPADVPEFEADADSSTQQIEQPEVPDQADVPDVEESFSEPEPSDAGSTADDERQVETTEQSVSEPDVATDPTTMDAPDIDTSEESGSSPGETSDPTGLVEVNELPPITQSEYDDGQSRGASAAENASAAADRRAQMVDDFASGVVQEMKPEFDTLRDHMSASAQEFMSYQTLILTMLRDQ